MLRLKNTITDTYLASEALIAKELEAFGEDRENYYIYLYPFGIERKDKQPIPQDVLERIQGLWKS